MSYDGATIEVVNWTKYNPRGEAKRPTWFRFDNSFAFESKFFGLSCEQKWLWVCILSLSSNKIGQPFIWNSAYIQTMTGVKKTVQDQTIDIFIKLNSLRATRTDSCDFVRDLAPTNERTNITNITNEHAHRPSASDFEILYQRYPRKMGKQEGIKKAVRDVKTQEEFEKLSMAIDRFKSFHSNKGTEERFIPYFSSFMSSWREWCSPETGSAEVSPSGVDFAAVFKKSAV